MVGTLSFSQPYLYIQPTLQSSPNTLFFTSVNFQLPIPALFVRKIIVTISTNTPFFYTSAQQSTPERFYLNQPIQGTSELQGVFSDYWNCSDLSLLAQYMDSDNRAHNHWFFVAQTQRIGILQVWKNIQSLFSQTRNLLSLLPYPTNNTRRTHIPQEITGHQDTWTGSFYVRVA